MNGEIKMSSVFGSILGRNFPIFPCFNLLETSRMALLALREKTLEEEVEKLPCLVLHNDWVAQPLVGAYQYDWWVD